MTLSPAPARTARGLLRLVGLLGFVMLAAACTTTEESLLDPDQDQADQSSTDDGSSGDDDTGAGDGTTGDGADDDEPGDAVGGDDLPFGDDGEPETAPEPIEIEDLTELSAPEEVIAEVEAELPADVSSDNVLDAIEPIDSDIDLSTDRNGRTTNESGELVGLDEPASLACANIEIALTALDEGDEAAAAAQVVSAAERAGSSQMPSVQAWSSPLAESINDGAVAEFAPLIGFISVCAEGGYEL